MGSGARQFKALMRKNFIQWKRQPGCSFLEICCPAVVMFLMVILRNVVDITTIPISKLNEVRQASMLGLYWDGSDWSTEQWGTMNADYEPFFKYGSYPNQTYYDMFGDYKIGTDPFGPMFFVPQQCIQKFSFQLPRVESPIIAIVGEQPYNEGTVMMQKYLEKLIEQQKQKPGEIKLFLDTLYGDGESADDQIKYPDFVFQPFDTKGDLWDYVQGHTYTFTPGDPGVCYGFQFEQDDSGKYTLELYFNDQQTMGGPNSIGIPNTQKDPYQPLATIPDTKGFVDYLNRGYSVLHNLGANIALKLEVKKKESDEEKVKSAQITYLNAPMPASNDTSDPYEDVITLTLPFLLLLIFIPPVYNMVFQIVKEKESRIKESMRMMGMKDRSYWLSWYVYYTCISTTIVFLAWLVLLINVMPNSNSFLVFLFFLFYAQAVFGEIVFLSSLFENSKYSGLVGTLIYFGMQLMGIPVQQPDSSGTAKAILSIIPQVAMQQNAAVFGHFEGSGLGLHFSNCTEKINNYTYLTGLIMLLISMVFFIALGFWMDAILPRTYGERKSVCFCFTRKFCRQCCGRASEVEEEQFDAAELQRRGTLRSSNDRQSLVDPFELKYLDKENYEPVPPEIARMELDNQFLKISDLTKTYPNNFKAVNGINLKMYNGQIFALLGHNGAGKSTTISMLTGLLSRTTGQGRIFNENLFTQMDDVRQYMGVCPQHDVLFDLLTPEEHLDIFYDFKGGDPARKNEELQGLIVDVGVAPDKNKVAGSLSGGNKRKLSVAIALCGNSRLVMLDEPTAGMDLSARRSLWDMLKNYRNNRIIILTTHYMDEADVLGDRIGIMGKGKILCLGTSLFLKNRYGAGYKLTMVKKHKQPNTVIQPYLEGVFGEVEKLSEVSQEITFKISYDQAAQFENFFSQFDERMDQLDILSYGISMTTLEEVFIKANEDLEGNVSTHNVDAEQLLQVGAQRDRRDSSINRQNQAPGADSDGEFSPTNQISPQQNFEEAMSSENLVGSGSIGESLKALLTKRFNIYKRDKCGLVCEVLVPVILVLFGMGLLQIGWLKDSPAFTLDTSAYPGPQRLLFNDANVASVSNQLTPTQLADSLPDASSYFETTYAKQSQVSTYEDFYKSVTQQQHVGDEMPYRFGSYQVYKADMDNYDFQINVFVNATSTMSIPYFQQYMYQSILKNVNEDVDFEVRTVPFPVFYVFESRVDSGQALDFGVLVSIALALIPCVIISFIIKEREKQLKHMQVISGVSLAAYWLSNIISDIVKTYVPIIIIIILTFVFQLHYDGVWELLMIYPIAIVPFTYITSFMFTNDTVAQIMTLFMHFLIGGIMPIVIFVLWNIPSTADLGDSMRWWFTPWPTYCVGEGIIFSSSIDLLVISRDGIRVNHPELKEINKDIYAFENLTGNYVIMVLVGIVGTLLLIIIEADIFQCCSKFSFNSLPQPRDDLDLDDDVIAEEERLAQQHLSRKVEQRDENNAPLLDPENLEKSPSEMDVIRVYNFRKAYTTVFGKPFLAVERISFGLDYGECFALLGVNGAGKSTTFKSLTRDIVPTSGDISIAGHDVLTEFEQARKLIGYCPQHDAIFDLMTVEEHLWFYARIKGIPQDRRQGIVEDAIKQLNLADHRSKPAGTLSGGNKRKLSVAMAIVGNPPIILLDEPSAGMDPEARRFMWSVVEKISQRDKKSAVILTTHSMEEAEALSTKMGIMVRGGIFRCFGSSQHIKNKFATGFEVQIKIRKPPMQEIEMFMDTLGLPDANLSARTDLEEAKRKLEQAPIEGLIIDQIRKDGVGSDLFVEAGLNNGRVRVSALVQFCFVHHNGFKVIEQLCRRFELVELIEQCGDYYKMRVPREDKTIGYLFGQIESMKKDMNIQEYGVQQTSLEQIFQNFAQMSIDDKAAFTFKVNALDQLMLMNPDRKSTVHQKRMSQKGRRSEKSLSNGSAANMKGKVDDEDLPAPVDDSPNSKLIK